MFTAVICECSTDDHRSSIYNVLKQYGFKKVARDAFESEKISENNLARLKKDIDRITDSYDILRFYQFPMEGTLIISSLKDNKWRRFKIV